MLSRLSVSNGPVHRLRLWYSARYLSIPPLHLAFCAPLPYSSWAVSSAIAPLSGSVFTPDLPSRLRALYAQ